MKANAPEKLYVDTEDRLSDSILYGFTEKRKEDDIEYIKKDAFVEKVESFLNRKDDRDYYTIGYIKRHLEEIIKEIGLSLGEYRNGAEHTLISLKDSIDTFEVKEVDLEKELNDWRHNHFHGRRDKEASGEYLERVTQLGLAKHFFELGLKAQHSSIGIPNIDDIFEEEGIDPNSKDVKIFKECYYMALEKLKEQKGEGV